MPAEYVETITVPASDLIVARRNGESIDLTRSPAEV